MQVQHQYPVTFYLQPWIRFVESERPDLILSGRDSSLWEFKVTTRIIVKVRVGALDDLVDHFVTEFYIDSSSQPNVLSDKVQLYFFTTSNCTIGLYLESSDTKIVPNPTIIFPVFPRRC